MKDLFEKATENLKAKINIEIDKEKVGGNIEGNKMSIMFAIYCLFKMLREDKVLSNRELEAFLKMLKLEETDEKDEEDVDSKMDKIAETMAEEIIKKLFKD